MNYEEMVLDAYYDTQKARKTNLVTKRQDMYRHLLSTYEELNKQKINYQLSEFFEGCFRVANDWDIQIEKKSIDSIEQAKLLIQRIEKRSTPDKTHRKQLVEEGMARISKDTSSIYVSLFEFGYYLLNSDIQQMRSEIEKAKEFASYIKEPVSDIVESNLTPQIQTNITAPPVKIKPNIVKEYQQPLFHFFQPYFEDAQHEQLYSIITTGGYTLSPKLIFKGNANQLTEAFKELYEANLIGGCQKKDLIHWIINNFQFIHRGETKDFVSKTVEKNISGKGYLCMKPILKVIDGVIERYEN